MRRTRIVPPLGALLLAAACAGVAPAPPPAGPAPVPPSAPAPPPPAPAEPPSRAPWVGTPLPAASVPAVYATEWRRAANRATCAPLAPAPTEPYAAAHPRAATFSGGWAVAYDLPERRSAFGIAGAGVGAEGPSYSGWPFRIRWSDGSVAEYGPEGGTGPNQLAYLRIPGQDCLYNVWSALGREHLEQLLARLRFVRVP